MSTQEPLICGTCTEYLWSLVFFSKSALLIAVYLPTLSFQTQNLHIYTYQNSGDWVWAVCFIIHSSTPFLCKLGQSNFSVLQFPYWQNENKNCTFRNISSGKGTGSGVKLLGFISWVWYLLALSPWTNHLTALCFQVYSMYNMDDSNCYETEILQVCY